MDKGEIEKQILDAATLIFNRSRMVTREALITATCLDKIQVDSGIRRLLDLGRLNRVGRGEYAVAEAAADNRAISHTILEDGHSILEIGDVCLSLTPNERLRLGDLFAASSLQFSAVGTAKKLDDLLEATSKKAFEKGLRYRNRAPENRTARDERIRRTVAEMMARGEKSVYAKVAQMEGVSSARVCQIFSGLGKLRKR